MAAPSAASSEQRELELVDKVDFRILNVANNEAKLQDLLGRYLAPLLLKAGSEHASVRLKVRGWVPTLPCAWRLSPVRAAADSSALGPQHSAETEDVHQAAWVSMSLPCLAPAACPRWGAVEL